MQDKWFVEGKNGVGYAARPTKKAAEAAIEKISQDPRFEGCGPFKVVKSPLANRYSSRQFERDMRRAEARANRY